MNKLQAVLFGLGTLVDRRDLERRAYNRVFDEAGLPWRWDAGEYARLCRLSAGGDVLDALIGSERPCWRKNEDVKHLLAAVRRRHVALCRDLAAEPAEVDREMIAVAEAARSGGLPVCAILPIVDALPEIGSGIACAETHKSALSKLNVTAAACIAIECTTEGFQAAADAGVAALDKLAISASSGTSSERAIMALLDDVHSNSKPVARKPRLLATALFV